LSTYQHILTALQCGGPGGSEVSEQNEKVNNL
jgi:hypothetical protein